MKQENDLKQERMNMLEACTLASEIMLRLAAKDPPISPKAGTEAMIVAIAISLKAAKPNDKKWAKRGAKLVGEMIGDVLDLLDNIQITRKEKQ